MEKTKYKIILGFLFVCFLINSVLAIWIVSISTTATYSIESQAYGGLVRVQELSSNNFNSLNDSAKFTDLFLFTNEGSEVDMNISISTIKTSTDVACSNWENDCDIIYEYNKVNSLVSAYLSDGSNIIGVPTGQNSIQVNVSCVQYSCPQDITPTINVEKIPV